MANNFELVAKKKKKYYVVWVGAKPGVYDTWDSCNAQIRGYPAAKYKSFSSLDQARQAFGESYKSHIGIVKKSSSSKSLDRTGIILESFSVDAACSGSPGIMEYRGVWTKDAVEVFHKGPFEWGTNNVGEFLALVHGLSYLKKIGHHHTPIYSDSRTAMSWLRNKKVKTTLERKNNNKVLFKLLERAENWINTHEWTNEVIKWPTDRWGEIPADFGRK